MSYVYDQDIGGILKRKDIYATNMYLTGDFTVLGNFTFGNASVDTLTLNGTTTVSTNNKIQFRDTGLFIHSSADGKITYSSDGSGADDHIFAGTVTFNNDVTGLVSTVTDAGHTHTGTVTDTGHTHAVPIVDGGHYHNSIIPINMGGITDALGAATVYIGGDNVTAAVGAAEEIGFVVPCSGTINAMYLSLITAPGGSDTVIATLRSNGADSTITCTVTGAATTANDTAHSLNVAAGEVLTIKLVSGAATAAKLRASIAMQVTASTATTGVTASGSSNTTGITVSANSNTTGVTVATV